MANLASRLNRPPARTMRSTSGAFVCLNGNYIGRTVNQMKQEKHEPDEAIEITPAMIDAGIDALWMFESDFGDQRQIVSAIYSSMWKAAAQSVPLEAITRKDIPPSKNIVWRVEAGQSHYMEIDFDRDRFWPQVEPD